MKIQVRSLLLMLALLSLLLGLPAAHAASNTITSPDTAGNVGFYTSLALDANGYPVVSYHHATTNSEIKSDLKLLHCNDANCTGGDESITSPDTVGNVGDYTSLALDAKGYPVVSYYDVTNGDLKLLHCNDANCVGGDESITSPDTVGNVGHYTSLALDAKGYPVVSYYGYTKNDLKLLHCNDANCAGGDESITSPDTPNIAGTGYFISLALDANGYPVVSYYDGAPNRDLKLLHCDDANCTGGGESITSPDTDGTVGYSTSLALDANGYPVVSYFDLSNSALKLLHCDDANCAGGGDTITSPDTAGYSGFYTSLALDANGYPVVSYYDAFNDDLKVLHCDDANCAGDGDTITNPDSAGDVGVHTSLALDANGYPVVSYLDLTNRDLKLLHCIDATCAGGRDTITSPDSADTVGGFTSLALDANGSPVVSYYDTTKGDLKLLHCNDANCTGGGERITSPDTTDDVGYFTSLALDAKGYPVVSYLDSFNGNLKLLHCNDANCAGGDESIISPDTIDNVGWYTSLALDANGYPVVSYLDFTNLNLKLLRCNDANCAGGDESITSPDTAGVVGVHTSLALDANGYPVISYFDFINGNLKLLHCNDANCTGGDDTITSPDSAGNVGAYTSLTLDANGYPVISYYDATNRDLKLLHCNDANCVGGNESITSPDTVGYVGEYTSLALDPNGYPVVSYHDATHGYLKLLHCNDAKCIPGGDTIISPDTVGTVGYFTSLALNMNGYPVVSYYDTTRGNLKLLHCAASNCLPDTTPPTVMMSSPAPDLIASGLIPVTVQFSEPITGFTPGDIRVGKATVSNFIAVDGDTYTFALVASGPGPVTADIADGVAQDAGDNPNTAAVRFSRTFAPPTPTDTPTDTPRPPTATPTYTDTPTDTPMPPTAAPTFTDTPTDTPTPTDTATNTPTPTPTPVPESNKIMISLNSNGNLPGVEYRDEDIIAYNPDSNAWSLVFDGSAVGLGNTDVDGFAVLPNGNLLLSTDSDFTLPKARTVADVALAVDDADVLEFVPTALGEVTAGLFQIYLDGSDVGLNTDNEDVDSIDIDPNGDLLLSVKGSFAVPAANGGATGNDEDLFRFSGTLGETSSGTWSLGFDGSDVLLTASGEDVLDTWSNGSTIYFSTLGDFDVQSDNTLSGQSGDIIACLVTQAEPPTTRCTFTLFFGGAAQGLTGKTIDGLSVGGLLRPLVNRATVTKPDETYEAPKSLTAVVSQPVFLR